MSKINFLLQIVMVGTAVAIGFFYINPTIADIKKTQALAQLYTAEIKNVSSVNEQLQQHVSEIDSISLENKQALLRYMPDSVDEVAVMKDINTIAVQQGIVPTTLSYSPVKVSSNLEGTGSFTGLQAYDFKFGATVTYNQLKALLTAMEKSAYLLRIVSLSVLPSDSGALTVDMAIEVYSRAAVNTGEVSNTGETNV